MDEIAAIYTDIPGGAELVKWFGRVPMFHDAEILNFDLQRSGASNLRVHYWNVRNEVDERGYFVRDKHAVVTFVLEEILDLQLEGFSSQNVIFGLTLKNAPDRPDRQGFYALDPSPQDFELELQPCYGLEGRIRCRSVSIKLSPGKPADIS